MDKLNLTIASSQRIFEKLNKICAAWTETKSAFISYCNLEVSFLDQFEFDNSYLTYVISRINKVLLY